MGSNKDFGVRYINLNVVIKDLFAKLNCANERGLRTPRFSS